MAKLNLPKAVDKALVDGKDKPSVEESGDNRICLTYKNKADYESRTSADMDCLRESKSLLVLSASVDENPHAHKDENLPWKLNLHLKAKE